MILDIVNNIRTMEIIKAEYISIMKAPTILLIRRIQTIILDENKLIDCLR
jgi:hypothetical protein